MTSAMHPENGIPEWTLTDRLRKARERTGLTPEQFAQEVDVSKATVYNYENPTYERKRKDIVLKRWAIRGGVPFGWLLNGSGSGPSDGGETGAGQYAPWDSNPEPADFLTRLARRNDAHEPFTVPERKIA